MHASDNALGKSAGERLREERNRLGAKQEDFAQLGGVNRNTQGSYEKDERSPDLKYLAAVAAHGADVLYVVTGVRALAATEGLSSLEAELVNAVRALPEAEREVVVRMVVGLAMGSQVSGGDLVNNG